ncbi:uncharacterized protein Tco025E_06545 [Trypanosoma conorhini]|uniref:Uncharacterized protein n=1 Tax=Trypanosoma conorhini TaxID=83891 RepID=A0A422P2S9_9TRYP|nr:uncharacterized protein Tco025E_06545 [Trypanosoma conorhini]RNF11975.1 hypothetical protein Tco025E_06545 [Trypanosoma conorhini]
MSEQREDATLEAATMPLTAQCVRAVRHFHTHILFLEDAFFSADQQKQEAFDVAHAFLAPVDASRYLAPEQMEGAEQRLQRLLRSFEAACQDDLAALREEGDALKQRMAHTIAVAEEKWGAAERRRQEEFVEMSVACQKEVAAMNAELRLGVLSCLQEGRMSAVLEEALTAKVDELRVLQGQLEEMTASRMNAFTEHQQLLQEERERHRERFLALQEETTRTVHELTLDLERQQHQHLREIRELRRQHIAQVKDLERQLHGEREAHASEVQRHTEAMDQSRAALRELGEAEQRLAQELREQQLQAAEWRRRYTERDTQAKLERVEQQAIADELRVEEAQAFRKQLVDTVRRRAASPFDLAKSTGTPLPGRSVPHSFSVAGGSKMQARESTGATEGSLSSSSSPHGRRTVLLSAVSSEGPVNPYATLTLHKPTPSYVRLMNLCEQVKKHVA